MDGSDVGGVLRGSRREMCHVLKKPQNFPEPQQ